MRIEKHQLQLSASDLAKHLASRHLTSLDLRAARGEIDKLYWNDPVIAVLQERGFRHEDAYLSYLKDRGIPCSRTKTASMKTVVYGELLMR